VEDDAPIRSVLAQLLGASGCRSGGQNLSVCLMAPCDNDWTAQPSHQIPELKAQKAQTANPVSGSLIG
jgi:hypothetical protein